MTIGKEINRRLGRFVAALEKTDELPKRFTCRTIRLNLKPTIYGPRQVKKVRAMLGASQAVFAQFIGVSRSAVRDWEQGLKPPNGAACRMIEEIKQNPAYFSKRLRELATPVTT
jgi:putative transcriptional regulator